MKRLTSLIMFLLLGVSLFAVEGILESRLVIVNEDGVEELVEAKTASPGDVLEYAYIITNDEEQGILSLQPSIPIPDSTTLMPETIEPKTFMVSVDGNMYFKYPVLDTEGKEVPNSAYKKVKWMLGSMKPGDQTTTKLRVKVDSE